MDGWVSEWMGGSVGAWICGWVDGKEGGRAEVSCFRVCVGDITHAALGGPAM